MCPLPMWRVWGGRRRRPVCGAMWRALVVAALCACALADDAAIGIVESGPRRRMQLAAAAAAALAERDPPRDVTIANVEPNEPLALSAHICALAASGVWAALTTEGAATAAAARAGLPLIVTGRGAESGKLGAHTETLHMYPHDDELAEAGVALALSKEWSAGVVLHARSPRPLLARAPPGLRLVPRALPPAAIDPVGVLLRNLLLVLKKSGARNFIIWGGAGEARRVLGACARVGLLSARHAFLVLDLDLHAHPLAPLSHAAANVTALRLRDPYTPAVRLARSGYERELTARLGLRLNPIAANVDLPAPLVLAQDAARLVAEALDELALPPAPPPPPRAACSGAAPLHADTLLNYLRSAEWGAAAGGAPQWAGGGRRGAVLQVVELAQGGALAPVGRWARGALTWEREPVAPMPRAPDDVTNRTLTVLVAVNSPYVMRREAITRLAGNERYEGFCVELVEQLGDILHFNFTLVEQADGVYGKYDNRTGEWTGMLRRLMDDPEIDLAITDLTLTTERVQAVDFTTPFMNLGIGILYAAPRPPEPDIFAFLLPFSKGVWVALGVSLLGTSLALFVCGRLCPAEWAAPFPCEEQPRALHNQFSADNALWFTLGAVLLQGSEVAPVSLGTRACASAWWVFALVITSSYTANLAGLLAATRSENDVHSVEELADTPLPIGVGAKAGGSTYTLFEQSQNPLYRKLYDKMRSQPLPTSNDEGIKRVAAGQYAFMAESTTIEYVTQRNCDVVQVGKVIESKDYGIAVKKSSPYLQALNLALLKLQESGVLREMKHTWWSERHGGGACLADDNRTSEGLNMSSFLGLFAVLAGGCACGLLGGAVQLYGAARRRWRERARSEPGLTYARHLARELRFVLRADCDERPVRAASPAPPASPAPDPATHPDTPSPAPPPIQASALTPAASLRSRRRSSLHAASVRHARAALAARRAS